MNYFGGLNLRNKFAIEGVFWQIILGVRVVWITKEVQSWERSPILWINVFVLGSNFCEIFWRFNCGENFWYPHLCESTLLFWGLKCCGVSWRGNSEWKFWEVIVCKFIWLRWSFKYCGVFWRVNSGWKFWEAAFCEYIWLTWGSNGVFWRVNTWWIWGFEYCGMFSRANSGWIWGCKYCGRVWRVTFGRIWGCKYCGGFSGWIWDYSVPREVFMDGVDFAWREIFWLCCNERVILTLTIWIVCIICGSNFAVLELRSLGSASFFVECVWWENWYGGINVAALEPW